MAEKGRHYRGTGSTAEDLFVELFCDVFGPEKTEYLFIQYPFQDIYNRSRFIDFALESEELKIAIEIDGGEIPRPCPSFP
ncbi:MAG: hypothetical protein ACOYI2_10740 [Bacillota bacterium]